MSSRPPTVSEAFQILQGANGPIVGLIDWEMPEMEGIEFAVKLAPWNRRRRFT